MMNLLSTLVLVSSLPLIQAQYNYNSATSSTTTAAASTTKAAAAVNGVHVVNAGPDFSYSPSSLNVAVGEKVEFHFFPPEHSVVEASFGNPCHPTNGTGFFSGFVTTSQESAMVFTVTVNDTNPIWFYCGVPTHCQAGMVGVINPPSSGPNTLDAFKSAAAKASDSTVPANVAGGVFGTASKGTSSSSSGSATTSASPSATANAASTMRVAGEISALMLLGLFMI